MAGMGALKQIPSNCCLGYPYYSGLSGVNGHGTSGDGCDPQTGEAL